MYIIQESGPFHLGKRSKSLKTQHILLSARLFIGGGMSFSGSNQQQFLSCCPSFDLDVASLQKWKRYQQPVINITIYGYSGGYSKVEIELFIA
jgi:hypothetical protein